MSYIFFDLEWNQGYPHNDAEKMDEIIQLGAYKLDSWHSVGESYSAYIRPSIHKKLHHRIRKMLPLDQKELFRAERFPDVIVDFFEWCGDDAIFFTWGPSDARVLDLNLAWYGMEEYLSIDIYDLQRAFDLVIQHTDQQTSLKDAVDILGLSAQLEFHDAGNDAAYTASIAAEMIRKLGVLPTEAELLEIDNALYIERKQKAAEQASLDLVRIFHQETPLLVADCGTFSNIADCLKSRLTRVFHCPKCENMLCNGNWYQLGESYVARSRCMEHGRFYSILRYEVEGRHIHSYCHIYTDEQFPSSLFSHCKLGGELIAVRKLSRKRKHNRIHPRKRTKMLTVKPAETRK